MMRDRIYRQRNKKTGDLLDEGICYKRLAEALSEEIEVMAKRIRVLEFENKILSANVSERFITH